MQFFAKHICFLMLFLNISILKAENEFYNYSWLDFNQAMVGAVEYSPTLPLTDVNWKNASDCYNKFIINNIEISAEPRIPKIIHHIWLGSPFPERCKTFQKTWQEQHPDWQYILWQEQDIENLNLINKKQYDAAVNYGEKSDIARYEILYRFGGLYIDTDFECLKPFDVLHHVCDFFSGIAYDTPFTVYNGLIGSRPEHPILQECIEKIAHNTPGSNDPVSVMSRTGPYLFTFCLQKYLSACPDKIVLFPVVYFYPWPNRHRYERARAAIEQYIRPQSFAIHHWHVSWVQ